jgi:broad specificity phosphatase PhoE
MCCYFSHPTCSGKTLFIYVHVDFLPFLAKCDSNQDLDKAWQGDDAPDPLTETGRLQADSLGRDWAGTHIDHLLSSSRQRARDTAKALSSHNEGHPEIDIHLRLVERRYGARVHRLMKRYPEAARAELGEGHRIPLHL